MREFLNSQPITPKSSEFDDFETLFPAHFLIGRPITFVDYMVLMKTDYQIENNRKIITKSLDFVETRLFKQFTRMLKLEIF